MTFLVILVAAFIDYKKLFRKLKHSFHNKIAQYAAVFVNRDFNTVREIRTQFLLAMIPFVIATALLFILPLTNLHVIYFLINALLFILSVDMFAWRDEARETQKSSDYHKFVQTFATKFFATTLWFIVFPSVLGSICYLTLTAMGTLLRARGEESMVYHMVVDKMLFWINIIPYTLLILLLALLGDFEEVMHYTVSQKDKIKISYFYLENTLNEVAFIAIGKDKFSHKKYNDDDSGIENFTKTNNSFDPRAVDFVVALLYRAGIFFILGITVASIIALL